jgi:hypothetical protein
MNWNWSHDDLKWGWEQNRTGRENLPMRLEVIKNRKQAVEFGLGICERFFDKEEARWSCIADYLPAYLRLEAQSALEFARDWVSAPNRQNRARVKSICQCLQDMVDEGNEQLRPLLCLCACVVCRDWRAWVLNASESAQNLLIEEFGPYSAGGVECETQAVHLHHITGCRLSDVISVEEDDVQGLEVALLEEEAKALGLQIVSKGAYNGFSFKTKSNRERFLVTAAGKPVAWSPEVDGMGAVLVEIKETRCSQLKSP